MGGSVLDSGGEGRWWTVVARCLSRGVGYQQLFFFARKVMGMIEGLLRGLWEKMGKKREIFG